MGLSIALKERFSKLRGTADPSAVTSVFGQAFSRGLSGGAIIFVLLIVWIFLRAPDTAKKMQDFISAQSIAIETAKLDAVPDQSAGPDGPSQKTLSNGRVIEPLVAAPIEGMHELVNGKTLPLIRFGDDTTPFSVYKRPHTAVEGRPQVSFVIVDFGLSSKIAQSMLDNLAPEISLVMSPYTSEPSKWASAARAYGHEFWLSLPMETNDMTLQDAGPDAIGTKASLEQNEKNTLNVLGTAVGYTGVVTAEGHRLVDADIAVAPSLKQIFGRGLAIAEVNSDTAAWGLTTALENAYPYVQNNFWIDSDLRPEAMDSILRAVELQATRKGKAIAFLHPYPLAIQKVQEWADKAEENGFQLAPLSAMVSQ